MTFFDLDADYCREETMTLLVSEGLAAARLKIREMLDDFMAEGAEWEQHALPQLNDLNGFVVAVLLGTNSPSNPDKTLSSFAWQGCE